MISVDEAQRAVLSRVPLLSLESVTLTEALSRVLRAPVLSDRDLPPFDRVAMDGFAVRSADVLTAPARLRVTGEVRAGVWPDRAVGVGEAMGIMTGAPLPEGADAVIPIERTTIAEGSAPGVSEVVVQITASAGQHIVRQGSEAKAGTLLLPEGVRLFGAHLAVLASVGETEPKVAIRPRVAVIVTGDEVVDPRTRPSAAQIRNANGVALMAAVQEAGGAASDFGVVSDDPAQTLAALERALHQEHDAIVLSGGVSAGAFDFVEEALERLGVTLHVTAVRVKPGAPFVFGSKGDTLVFGLPGNPVSAQVTFELFVRPALLKMQGARAFLRPQLEAILDGSLSNRSQRRNYLPVTVERGGDGLRAKPIRSQGSGDVVAHAAAQALAYLEPDRTAAQAGETVALYPLSSFLEV